MEHSLPQYDEFKDSLVAFIDVLGMNSRVKAIKGEEDFVRVGNLLFAIKKVANDLTSAKDVLSGFRFTAVSDSLIATVPLSYPSCAASLFLILHSLQHIFLLQFRTLVRGYISRGPVYHQNEILFGAGYSDAYKGEGLIGGAPRIVVDPKIVLTAQDEIAQVGRHNFFGTVLDFIAEDPFDGFYFIDYLKPIGARAETPMEDLNKELVSMELVSMQGFVAEKLKEFKDDYRIYPKYRWLQGYIERCSSSTNEKDA